MQQRSLFSPGLFHFPKDPSKQPRERRQEFEGPQSGRLELLDDEAVSAARDEKIDCFVRHSSVFQEFVNGMFN